MLRYFYFIFIIGILSRKIDAIRQDFVWRDYIPGDIPCDAIPGALGKYIGQVNYKGNMVGTIYQQQNLAFTEMGGRVNITQNIKILCSQRPNKLYWESVDFNRAPGEQMKNAVKGGYQEQPSFDLYIGRVMHEGEWKISKVVDMNHQDKGIWVWTQNGGSARYYQFELLKAKYVPSVSCCT